MRKFGQLGVVAKQHHALRLVAKLANDVEQVVRVDRLQPIIHYDVPELVIKLLSDDLRRREGASGRTRHNQIGLHIERCQSLTHLRGIALAEIIQWPIFVRQRRIVPA